MNELQQTKAWCGHNNVTGRCVCIVYPMWMWISMSVNAIDTITQSKCWWEEAYEGPIVSVEQPAIFEQPLFNDRDIESCNCHYCQSQIETHNLADSSYHLSLSKKTGLAVVCTRCREPSVDTQGNWMAGMFWTHGEIRGEMNTWSERFYVLGDDFISHNVYFIAQYAINLHAAKSQCDTFI